MSRLSINTINVPRGDYDRGMVSWNPITDFYSPQEQPALHDHSNSDYKKRCRTCGRQKLVSADRERSEFYLYKNRANGCYLPLSDCKPCHYLRKTKKTEKATFLIHNKITKHGFHSYN